MKSFSKTVLGKVRQSNQDYCIMKNERVGVFDNLFIVADGVGGNSKSAFASKHSCDFLVEQLSKTKPEQNIIEELSTAIKLANTDLYYHILSNEEYNGMGTTLVIATISKKRLIVANVGDSRCYYIRKGFIKQITHDHSVAEELVRENQIERGSDKYLEFKNQLTRAVGASRKIKPDFFELELNPKDYILLCSDGLTNMVNEEYIANIISKEQLSLEDKVNLLIDKANENGGKDNITIMIIQVENYDLEKNTSHININLNKDDTDNIETEDIYMTDNSYEKEDEEIIDNNKQKNEYSEKPKITKDPNLVSPDDILNKYKPKSLNSLDRESIQIDEVENMSNLRVNPQSFINKDEVQIYEGLKGRSRKRKDFDDIDINFNRKEDNSNE